MASLFFFSATAVPGWAAAADKSLGTRLFIHWTNLSSLLSRQVRYYIVLANKTDGNKLSHKITDGKRLHTEIDRLQQSTTYITQVFGVDELGRSYRTQEVNAKTEKCEKDFVGDGFVYLSVCMFINLLLMYITQLIAFLAIKPVKNRISQAARRTYLLLYTMH